MLKLVNMKVAAILLLFLLVGAMARPEASELRSSLKSSMDSSLHAPTAVELSVRHRRSADGEDRGNTGDNSSPLNTFLGRELGSNMRHLLGILGVHDINDVPRLIAEFSNGTTLRPIIRLLNSISPADIRSFLEGSGPLQAFTRNIPIINTMASYATDIANLPNNIMDSIVNLILNMIQNMAKTLTRIFL